MQLKKEFVSSFKKLKFSSGRTETCKTIIDYLMMKSVCAESITDISAKKWNLQAEFKLWSHPLCPLSHECSWKKV